MKRCLSAILAAVLLAVLAPPAARAEGGWALVVNTSRLNVRSGPGTGYPAVGSVPGGEWVEVFNTTGSWIEGRTPSGQVGFMSASFLRLAIPGSVVIGSQAVVNNPVATSYLNLREAPSYTARVLGTYYNGAVCTVLGQTDGWYYVEISGLRGYFRSEFLKPLDGPGAIGDARITSANGGPVNLRAAPSLTGYVIGQGANGTTVQIYLQGKAWWFVALAGTFGFMDAKFLTGGSGPTPPIVIPDSTDAIVTNTGRNLNLREQPSTSCRVLGSYPANTALTILMQGTLWSRVKVNSDGKTGYMMTKYLTLYGQPAVPMKTVRHPDGTYVNLRSKPSQAAGSVTTRVPHGSRVTVVIAGGTWAQVKYGSVTGYMMTQFLK
ncbi:MAG TPA: SH3 domain-containing protein [Candidatus Limnocylindria bacterium]|nr:SH3 domain-containing protein [Candidatus Limnocylindria bacterium]